MSETAQAGIIMRTKDRPLLLRRAIASVVNQNFQDWRLAIVNDGGDPAPVEALLREYEERLKGRARVFHNKPSRGMEAASNQAVRMLETRHLTVHDDDDTWERDFLRETLAHLENPPHPAVKGCITHSQKIVERITGEKIIQIRAQPYNNELRHISLYEMLCVNKFPPISFVFEKAACEAAGPFREDLPVLGDWEFNIRFLRRFEISVIPKVLANYHFREKKDTSVYGNTVTAEVDKHVFYDNLLRNEWLRADIGQGRMGEGFLANHAKHHFALAGFLYQRLPKKILKWL